MQKNIYIKCPKCGEVLKDNKCIRCGHAFSDNQILNMIIKTIKVPNVKGVSYRITAEKNGLQVIEEI